MTQTWVKQGFTLILARVFPGMGRDFESWLKTIYRKSTDYCPCCNPDQRAYLYDTAAANWQILPIGDPNLILLSDTIHEEAHHPLRRIVEPRTRLSAIYSGPWTMPHLIGGYRQHPVLKTWRLVTLCGKPIHETAYQDISNEEWSAPLCKRCAKLALVQGMHLPEAWLTQPNPIPCEAAIEEPIPF